MKCIIVDDELMARKSLDRLCSKVDFLEVVAMCENGKEALDAMDKHDPDLIFLDMEMPELTGIEFLETVAVLPQVIFFTSKKEFAATAFEYQVTDFLHKPTNFPRFLAAVNKAHKIFKQENALVEVKSSKSFFIREEGRLCRVDQDEMLYLENVGDYIRIVTTERSHIIHGTLKGIMPKINDARFIKVHRSYIVNLTKIKDIEDNSLVIGKKVIPISRANKPLLLEHLNML